MVKEKEKRDENAAEDAAIPIKPKRTWPAVMFAASRKDKVIKRTEILIVSIITRKGLSQSGAPLGNKPAANDFGA